ncbi:MAG: hypothetical protein M1829_003203 [Trizodia sp. TS-e1964]|nr:MAG: hypothetical protein M1829_003203 [Trizodia sp. TS-e1964]
MLLHLTLLTSALAGLALASPRLAARDKPDDNCEKNKLVKCLEDSPTSALSYCNSVLGTSTITAQTVTPSKSVTSTITVTKTNTNTVSSTTTSTLVITTAGTQTITSVSTSLTTTTATVNSIIFIKKKARRDDDNEDKHGLSCATKDPYPSSEQSSACSCLYTRHTTTVTPTAATKTILSLTTTSPIVTITVTIISTVPATITTTSISTTITTTTTASTAVSTISVPEAFTLVVGPFTTEFCIYTNNDVTLDAPIDPGPNNDYITGVNFCRDSCAGNPSCDFFLYVFDPSTTSATCFISYTPFDQAAALRCGPSTGTYVLGYALAS